MGFTDYELEPLFKETSPFLRIMVYYHFLLEMTKILCQNNNKNNRKSLRYYGFKIRFFTKEDIKYFINDNFKIKNII